MVHSLSPLTGRWSCALASALLGIALTAQAQPAPRAAKPDPLDPKARVPALRYESSFAPYRKLDDGKPIAWRDANDTVARIGGWRVYAREAQQPEPPAAPASANVDKPAGTSGHQTP